MNNTTVREAQIRNLAQRIAQARQWADQLSVERDTSIRRHGVAHPQSIAITRRLNDMRSDHRSLQGMHRASVSHDAQIKGHK